MKIISLTRGMVAVVDDDLYQELSQYAWSIDGSGYPQRNYKSDKGWRPMRMHRHILKLGPGERGDHRDRNKLNNQKANLRNCTIPENIRNVGLRKNNTAGFKGVHYNAARQTYQAYITHGKHIYLGGFENPREAAVAYDEAAIRMHGEFACTNQSLGLLSNPIDIANRAGI